MSEPRFSITIIDTVFHDITLDAADAAAAENKAWQLFESDERSDRFTDRCDTSIDIEEVQP